MIKEEQQDFQRQVQEAFDAKVEKFEQWARNCIAYDRGERARFQARLSVRWQKALELFELISVEVQDLGATFNQRYRPVAASNDDYVFDVLTTCHAKACLLASEVFALLVLGHAYGAFARWRSLHEVFVVAKLVRESGRDLAERYILHEYVQRWRAAKDYQKHAAALGVDPSKPDMSKNCTVRSMHYARSSPIRITSKPMDGRITSLRSSRKVQGRRYLTLKHMRNSTMCDPITNWRSRAYTLITRACVAPFTRWGRTFSYQAQQITASQTRAVDAVGALPLHRPAH